MSDTLKTPEYETHLTDELMAFLHAAGADLAGAGRLSDIPAEKRYGLPIGVSVSMKLPGEIVRQLTHLPTKAYSECYADVNHRLDRIVTAGQDFLRYRGYRAIAKSYAEVGPYDKDCRTVLPHKTIATRAGLGWIGKSALLITPQYGSMIRLSSILTDAPLVPAAPVNTSRCGGCTVCRDACPGHAIHGNLWDVSVGRDRLIDYRKCLETCYARSLEGFGEREDICGKCFAVCPWTQRYLRSENH